MSSHGESEEENKDDTKTSQRFFSICLCLKSRMCVTNTAANTTTTSELVCFGTKESRIEGNVIPFFYTVN